MRNHRESNTICEIINSIKKPYEQIVFETDVADAIKQIHSAHTPICRMVGNRYMPDGTSEMCMEVSEHLQNAMRVLKELESFPLGEMASPPTLPSSQGDAEPSQPDQQPCELSLSAGRVRGALREPDQRCTSCGREWEWFDCKRTPDGTGATMLVCPACGGDVADVE